MDIGRPWLFLAGIVVLELVAIAFLAVQPGGTALEGSFVESPPLDYNDTEATHLDLDYFFAPDSHTLTHDNINKEGLPYAVYHLNNDGLRERYNYSRDKPDDVFRIGFFGDSFLWGHYVNNSDLWTEKLERRLNKMNCEKDIQVINFGVNAYDNPYSVEFYLQRGRKYDLDLKGFIVKDDDIMEAMEIYKPIIEKHKREYMKRYDLERPPTPPSEKYHEMMSDALAEYKDKIKRIESNRKEDLLERQVYEPFDALERNVEDDSSVIIFSALARNYNDLYKREAEKRGFRFISMNRMGDKYGYDGLWGHFSFPKHNDVHPNVMGHEFISDFMYIYLVSNNLINCNTYEAFEAPG